MKPSYLLGLHSEIPVAIGAADSIVDLEKRDAPFTCDWTDSSLLCLSANTLNAQGPNVLTAHYFGLQNSSLPDSTTYNSGENIISVTDSNGPTIEFSVGAGVGAGGASANVGARINVKGSDNGGKIYLATFLRDL
jgi:hypothetical protein